jgi:hypothetical protein
VRNEKKIMYLTKEREAWLPMYCCIVERVKPLSSEALPHYSFQLKIRDDTRTKAVYAKPDTSHSYSPTSSPPTSHSVKLQSRWMTNVGGLKLWKTMTPTTTKIYIYISSILSVAFSLLYPPFNIP